jgi:hypothetical protein
MGDKHCLVSSHCGAIALEQLKYHIGLNEQDFYFLELTVLTGDDAENNASHVQLDLCKGQLEPEAGIWVRNRDL